jgi:hypothetical protein
MFNLKAIYIECAILLKNMIQFNPGVDRDATDIKFLWNINLYV